MSEDDSNIRKLSMFQENMQGIANQRQQYQSQLIEIESALKEVEGSADSYKIIGNIMVKTDKDKLTEELRSKKEMAELRIKTLEKQEDAMKEKSKKLQEDILSKMKKG